MLAFWPTATEPNVMLLDDATREPDPDLSVELLEIDPPQPLKITAQEIISKSKNRRRLSDVDRAITRAACCTKVIISYYLSGASISTNVGTINTFAYYFGQGKLHRSNTNFVSAARLDSVWSPFPSIRRGSWPQPHRANQSFATLKSGGYGTCGHKAAADVRAVT